MKRIYIPVILFLICFYSGAQVTGYLGKRLTLTPSLQFMPALRPAYIKEFGDTISVFNRLNYRYKDPIPWNIRPGIEIEYVLGRAVSAGAGFSYYHPGVTYDSLFIPADFTQIPYHKTDVVRINSFIYAAHVTIFRSGMGYLAPVGAYNRIDMVYMDNHVKDEFGPSTRYRFFTFGYTSGYQRVYKNKIIVDVGAQLLLNGRVLFHGIISHLGQDYEYQNRLNERIAFGTFMSFHFRCGYIL